MSLLGYAKLFESMGPRCPQCNRKMRNRATCKVCWGVLCSQNCLERHVKSAHADVIQAEKEHAQIRQEAIRTLAEKDRREARKRERIEYKNKLDELRFDLDDAKQEVEECRMDWQDAGSPKIHPEDLQIAKETASKLRLKHRALIRKQKITSSKSMYLRLAQRSRGTVSKPAFPWYGLMLIVGIGCFAVACIVGLLISRNVGVIFGAGTFGLMVGFTATLCLLYYPNDGKLASQQNDLTQHQLELQDQIDDAKRVCDKALQDYNKLSYLDEIHAAYEDSIRRKRQIEDEYHAERHG